MGVSHLPMCLAPPLVGYILRIREVLGKLEQDTIGIGTAAQSVDRKTLR